MLPHALRQKQASCTCVLTLEKNGSPGSTERLENRLPRQLPSAPRQPPRRSPPPLAVTPERGNTNGPRKRDTPSLRAGARPFRAAHADPAPADVGCAAARGAGGRSAGRNAARRGYGPPRARRAGRSPFSRGARTAARELDRSALAVPETEASAALRGKLAAHGAVGNASALRLRVGRCRVFGGPASRLLGRHNSSCPIERCMRSGRTRRRTKGASLATSRSITRERCGRCM